MIKKIGAIVIGLMLASNGAQAATDIQKCAAGKIKLAAKYTKCRLLADAKSAKTGEPADYTKCDAAQLAKWAAIEDKYDANCLVRGDQSAVQNDVTGATDCLVDGLVDGSGPDCDLAVAQLCGNGVIDPGEVCDQSDLGGATCGDATAGAAEFGTLACGANCAAYDSGDCIACPGGTVVNGVCWVLSALGDACVNACAAIGMVYDEQTRTYAGSDGSLGHCAGILNDLGGNPNPEDVVDGGPSGIGCFIGGGGAQLRGPGTTTAQSSSPFERRACACH